MEWLCHKLKIHVANYSGGDINPKSLATAWCEDVCFKPDNESKMICFIFLRA